MNPERHPSEMPASDSQEAAAPLGAEELFVRHSAFIRRFLHRLGVPAQELDDIVQEVFLVAHHQGGYVDRGARPTTWLAEIALRMALALRRSSRRGRGEPELLDGVATKGPSPYEALATTQSLHRVQRALETLDLDHKAVFVLFELEDESCETIAQGLGLPIGTVHSRLHYARRAFQKAYDRLALMREPRTVAARGGAT
jgi:RNA polymerase sigma-70 factor (ECF subfamily)